MLPGPRSLLLVVCTPLILSACGQGSYGSSIGGTTVVAGAPPPSVPVIVTAGFATGSSVIGTHDGVIATPSYGSVAVVVGSSQTVSVAFDSSDGRVITGFGVSDTLATLPAGWTGPASFSCASVSIGSNCVVNLTYSPVATGAGTLTINYVYIDDASQPKTGGSLAVAYVATASDNVVATASPTGQINSLIGKGSQAVSINFTTDDGNAATNLAVTTDLTALPTGWSSTAPGLACAIVSTGSGCELVLNYAPTAAASGTLTLSYGYVDDAGALKTGTLNVAYAAASENGIVATPSPTAQVIAVQKTGGQPVAVTFTTDDGTPATSFFVTSNLKALPPGWSTSSGSLSCAKVSTGNGCLLALNYAPTALASGTLTVNYAYVDGGGTAQTGMLNVGYAATTNDNVVGTPSPAGQINAVTNDGARPGTGIQPVTVTFTTDDGRPATALQLTSNLAGLPAGWSSPVSALDCSGLNTDNICQLPLIYAPAFAGNGTLMLTYTYKNNANESKTGTVSIPYRATANDGVSGTASLSSIPPLRTGSSASVVVSFSTDDGNPAAGLAITSGLTPLPAGWSMTPTGLTCATVSAAAVCATTLTYAPTTAASASTLTLGFSYLNDAGYPGTGTVSVPYSAFTPYLYVANDAATTVSACPLDIADGVGSCVGTGSAFNMPSGIALYGNYAYVTNTAANSVSRCTLDGMGALSTCASTGGAFTAPSAINMNPMLPFAYVEQGSGLSVCAIAGDGALAACIPAATAFEPLGPIALSADGTHAYGVHTSPDPMNPANVIRVIDVCTVSVTDGTLGACLANPAGVPLAGAALAIHDGDLYVTTSLGALYMCPIDSSSNISSCQTTAVGTNATGIAFEDGMAFLSTGAATVLRCPVNSGGTLGMCSGLTDPAFSATRALAIR